MSSFPKVAYVVVLGFVLLLGILAGRYAIMHIEGWFQPREQSIQRDVFKQTRSFDEGKRQELVRLRLQHARADSDVEKKAIESAVRHNFADYDTTRLPSDLQVFVEQCN